MSLPRKVGVVRTMRPAELRPIFGQYRASLVELLPAYAAYATLYSFVAFLIVLGFQPTATALGVAAALLVVGLFAAAIAFDAASVRSFTEGEIAYRAPLRSFSWSVPLAEIDRCELVQASPHCRLRVFTHSGATYSLPLTTILWARLTDSAVTTNTPS